jgi:(p)ppGpp synthase/HD superfamily hydrolase
MAKRPTLQRAIELAIEAHAGQEDLPGEPYITHPMRVMLALADSGEHELRMVGILHDAVERGSLTLKQLAKEGFSKDVIRGVELMTHDDDTSYADYVVALKKHRLARLVKLADLRDNADLRHVDMRPEKFKKDRMRATRYILSARFLTDEIDEKTYRRLMARAESRQ